jgi:hypothetical protein
VCNHCHNKIPLHINLKLNSLKDRLSRFDKVLNESYPGNSHLIPSPEQIDIQKLSHGGLIMSDTCNQAQIVMRLLAVQIDGSYDYDCMHHLRNVWFENAENALTKDLNVHLRASLDEIDPTLHVTMSMSAIIRAVDKDSVCQQTIQRAMERYSLNGYRNIILVFFYCMSNEPLGLGMIYAQKDLRQYTSIVHSTLSFWTICSASKLVSLTSQVFCNKTYLLHLGQEK